MGPGGLRRRFRKPSNCLNSAIERVTLGVRFGGVTTRLTRQQVLDLYFMEARCKLIEIAAFMDRVERSGGEADFRWAEFCGALEELNGAGDNRAERVLLSLSDPTTEPIAAATGKGAVGAWRKPD